MYQVPKVDRLVHLFNKTFVRYETLLVAGGKEPLYQPKQDDSEYHKIVFTHDYFSSALHEVAHWCIAGDERRQQIDYGYWYCPDGRSLAEQADFEKVEVKPQAIEWAFSLAANIRFRVSADNLNGEASDLNKFRSAVKNQLVYYFSHGFPARAEQFIAALQMEFETRMKFKKFDVSSVYEAKI